MRVAIFFLVVFLFGCASVAPEYVTCTHHRLLKTYAVGYCGEVEQDFDFEKYIATFERMWNDDPLFPHNSIALHEALNMMIIFWQPHIFRAPENNTRLLGLTYPRSEGKIRMYVYLPPNCHDAGCTALGHELLHLAYGAVTGNMYPNHLTNGPRWPISHNDFLARVRDSYLGRHITDGFLTD